jgi:tetratricopeptide (TPR) repeat protein
MPNEAHERKIIKKIVALDKKIKHIYALKESSWVNWFFDKTKRGNQIYQMHYSQSLNYYAIEQYRMAYLENVKALKYGRDKGVGGDSRYAVLRNLAMFAEREARLTHDNDILIEALTLLMQSCQYSHFSYIQECYLLALNRLKEVYLEKNNIEEVINLILNALHHPVFDFVTPLIKATQLIELGEYFLSQKKFKQAKQYWDEAYKIITETRCDSDVKVLFIPALLRLSLVNSLLGVTCRTIEKKVDSLILEKKIKLSKSICALEKDLDKTGSQPIAFLGADSALNQNLALKKAVGFFKQLDLPLPSGLPFSFMEKEYLKDPLLAGVRQGLFFDQSNMHHGASLPDLRRSVSSSL